MVLFCLEAEKLNIILYNFEFQDGGSRYKLGIAPIEFVDLINVVSK